jgi:hypothetical protein
MSTRSKIWIISTCIVIVGIIILCIIDYRALTVDKQLYEYVVNENTTLACRVYFNQYPKNGRYDSEVRSIHEKLLWKKVDEIYSLANEKLENLYDVLVKDGILKNTDKSVFINKMTSDPKVSIDLYDRLKKDGVKVPYTYENFVRILGIYEKTILPYNNYLNEYPHGKYSTEAKEKIERQKQINISLEKQIDEERIRLRKEREEAVKWDTDSKAWNEATSRNTLVAYKKYIKLYPYGAYAQRAKKLVIDKEVDEIFGSEHEKLPSMKQTSYGYGDNTTVSLYNKTSYVLTIRYSGTESKKIDLSPQQRLSISLKNGTYRVTASANNASVRNYAGTEVLSGGGYDSQYYIQTSRY